MELTGPTKIAVPGHLKKYEFGVIITFAYPLENSGMYNISSSVRARLKMYVR